MRALTIFLLLACLAPDASAQSLRDLLSARRAQPAAPAPLQAQDIRCIKVNGEGKLVEAPAREMARPNTYRQVLILPAGYQAGEKSVFAYDVDTMARDMGNLPEGVFTSRYREQLIYVAAWIPDGGFSKAKANFGARIIAHPMRGGGFMTLGNEKVVKAVADLQAQRRDLDPIGVIVVYNTSDSGTANAVPPTILGQKFGLARLTSGHIHNRSPWGGRTVGEYVAAHELAHAAINLYDEYIESGMASLSPRDLDRFTPLLHLDGSLMAWRRVWRNLTGDYDVRMSEIVMDNGAGNVSTRRVPSLVHTPGYIPLELGFEGSVFGRGVYHGAGDNLMNANWSPRGPKPEGDRFGWGHSPAQMEVLEQVFDPKNAARRPNDRIRPAGPLRSWVPRFGATVPALLFDADKNNRWHPTQKYEIEVRWQERGSWRGRTMEVEPTRQTMDLRQTLPIRVASRLRNLLVAVGVRKLPASGKESFNISLMTVEQMMDEFLPSATLPLPYQEVRLPAPIPFRAHEWRFRTFNGTMWSGWTEWTGFYRAM